MQSKDVKKLFPAMSNYKAIHYLINHEHFHFPMTVQEKIEAIEKKNHLILPKHRPRKLCNGMQRIKHDYAANSV